MAPNEPSSHTLEGLHLLDLMARNAFALIVMCDSIIGNKFYKMMSSLHSVTSKGATKKLLSSKSFKSTNEVRTFSLRTVVHTCCEGRRLGGLYTCRSRR